MGISNMQGEPWHIEYVKTKGRKNRKVNCGFWINGICYNNIALKYGEECNSKSRCMYSK